MALLTTGKKFIRDVETHGAVAVYAPLEGGFEGRYLRRLRASGYEAIAVSGRGLGDLPMYLTGVHGVRPPHLGKKTVGNEAAVGYVNYIPPIVNYQLEQLPTQSKGLVVWIIDGSVFSSQELEYLVALPKLEPKVKVIVEIGGDRAFRWQPLKDTLVAA
ncbi:NAD(P)H-quinone oxidoreductase subunit N [Kamptonema cortianum]|nr:NAD(P)H-quinone oxidoreductase subunit N [Oscillatoria laete-virens]MDI9639563.1 NAD(P)H-quinone oxidoreductase subunit N [Geitlerinema splendidum]MDK3162359.1 NAD(P)H-quinone oxidoreductase subunit N [Kamptonema cortianum]MDL5051652.1 NAD(P)H-quinone oxidoreductase subunit N [Oscillatoria amoena NRMC-F 0135]MDL5052218.1 NAD(P)H-quinone oxidoreductase subunit N [Oscillatoria laete-virens NRMC-F 0139]